MAQQGRLSDNGSEATGFDPLKLAGRLQFPTTGHRH
jgi:hypothetical protein